MLHGDVELMVAAGLTGGLDFITPEGRKVFHDSDVELVADAVFRGESVVFDNPKTLTKVAALADEVKGRWMLLMGSLPMSRVSVATKALAHKFWHPMGEPNKLRHWMEPLGIDSENPWPVVAQMKSGSLNPAQDKWAERLAKFEDGIAESLAFGTSGAVMNKVYTSMSAAHQCIEAYFATDPIRVEERIASGDSTKLTVFEVRSGSVRAWLSNPCKVKVGDLMLFDGHDSPGNVGLDAIGWDSSRQMLYGVFTRPKDKVRGYGALTSANTGDTFMVSAVPYVGAPRSGQSWWANSWTAKPVAHRQAWPVASPGVSRSVPADVLALAN